MPVKIAAAQTTMAATALSLSKDIVEPQKKARAFTSTEGQIESKARGPADARPEAESVIAFERSNVAELGTDGAGVIEERALYELVDAPAILGLQQQRASITEAERPEAAERVRAAERRLQVERHRVVLRRVARRGPRPKRKRARVMHERDELPQIHVPAVERESIEIAIRVA